MLTTPFPARSTPFPSHLLDDVMPLLSDTEWRLLCVVVRQTLGWEDGQGGRKVEDWLTQSQLKARTGRASEALSRAIEGLVRKGLILVCSEAGEPLATPQERRHCPGRLLFGLAPQVLAAPKVRRKSPCSEGEYSHSQSEQGAWVSELRKANTTKETKDKITPGGVRQGKQGGVDKPVENSEKGRRKEKADIGAEQSGSDVRRFLLAYQEQFASRNVRGEAPPLAWGRDGKLVKGLLAQYGYERLVELLKRFFASEDAWAKKRGYALSCFPTLLPTLLMEEGRTSQAQEAQRRAQATPVVVQGPSARYWQQADVGARSATSLFERYPHLRDRVRSQPP